MMLVADSGSTKCDWVLVNGSKKIAFETVGFNPVLHDATYFFENISANKELFAVAKEVKKLFFYCAGGSAEVHKNIAKEALSNIFSQAEIHVEHDLLASALATYDGHPGISCILGTGSNSCYFDGKNLSEATPSLGYILGDEASGSYFGKRLLRAYFYGKLPKALFEKIASKHHINKDEVIENTYRKPNANRYLASFMKIVVEFKEEDFFKAMVKKGFEEFIDLHVLSFKEAKSVPIHFIGSIAHIFEKELKESLEKSGLKLGRIIQKPIDGLVKYHENN